MIVFLILKVQATMPYQKRPISPSLKVAHETLISKVEMNVIVDQSLEKRRTS